MKKPSESSGYKKSIEHFMKTENFISPTAKPKTKALSGLRGDFKDRKIARTIMRGMNRK